MSSNAIARTDDTRASLEVLPPARPVMSTARQVLMEHAELAVMAYEFCDKVCRTSMVPDRFRNKPEEATAAVLYGAELGISPIAALQNIFAVHGTPSIYARTAQALLEGKGFQFKTVENTNTTATVHGWKPGRNPDADGPDEVSTFTYDDAERAGWTPQVEDSERGGRVINGVRYKLNANGKLAGNEKYLTQPRQMLWAKAMMEVCRRLSPATLLGIAYSVEELESEQTVEPPALAERPAATDALTVEEILAATPDKADDAAMEGKPKGHTSRVEAALAKARAESQKQDQDAAPPAGGTQPATETARQDDDDEPEVPGRESEPQMPADDDKPPTGDRIYREPEPSDDASDPEPTPDPSETEPTGDDQPPPPLDMGDDPAPEPQRDDRPATKEQLQDLTQLIAAAGFQPTDEGRTQWFAFVSQTVDRNITANNQLTRDEIGRVSQELRDS